jgi:hypothetical protein
MGSRQRKWGFTYFKRGKDATTQGVQVIRTKYLNRPGEYFWFDENLFGAYFNNEHWKHNLKTKVEQWRGGKKIWEGQVIVWRPNRTNKNSHGRRTYRPRKGQWRKGDTIKPAPLV